MLLTDRDGGGTDPSVQSYISRTRNQKPLKMRRKKRESYGERNRPSGFSIRREVKTIHTKTILT